MRTGPVLGVVVTRQFTHQIPGHLRSLKQVLQFQPNALDLARFPATEPGSVINVNHGQRAVQLGTHLENAGHGEALESRKDPRRSNRGLRQHECQLVTHRHVEALGYQLADHDAELSCRQIIQRARLHVVFQNRDALLCLRLDTVDQHRRNAAVVRQHALKLNKGCSANHLRILLEALGQRLPVTDRLVTVDCGVWHHTENPCAQLPIKAVHHRQHQDHDHNAQRQPEHGNQRDEGNEMISPLGAGIAQADKKG